ncbi:hypothetical protein [Cupriavidus agavae]|uniref:hypothetical protein n=1 Tax=Cupriavidus agavae TaxID=1001822 RepID=UPI00102D22D1|nr:hypothetical protein [Cupriavidus agavae]
MKPLVLWLKKNRSLLVQHCAGSVAVVSNRAAAVTLQPLLVPLGKVFGVPMRAVTQDQLDAEIDQLLAFNWP